MGNTSLSGDFFTPSQLEEINSLLNNLHTKAYLIDILWNYAHSLLGFYHTIEEVIQNVPGFFIALPGSLPGQPNYTLKIFRMELDC